jgi:metal-sulfur cluster biosynthetic enzyme
MAGKVDRQGDPQLDVIIHNLGMIYKSLNQWYADNITAISGIMGDPKYDLTDEEKQEMVDKIAAIQAVQRNYEATIRWVVQDLELRRLSGKGGIIVA